MNVGTFVLGLLNGSTIGLLAVGFVLIYKSNRFLNLAHAQLGAVSALLLAKVVGDWGWNWWVSFLACIAVGVATGTLVEHFLVAPVRRKTKAPTRLLMLSIGVSQLLLAITYLPHVAPSTARPYPQPFVTHLQIGGVVLSGMSVLVMIVVPVLLVLLTGFLEFTSIGKQIRAAAGNPDAARLCGISVNRVSLITWGVAGGLSALSAVFNGPTTSSFNASAFGPYLLMLTMGAAAFGAFISIPAAVLGGIGLGVVYQVVLAETSNAGTAEVVVFAAILLVILLRGRVIGRVFAASGAAVPERPGLRVPDVLRRSPVLRFGPWWLGGAALAVAVVFPWLPYFSSEGNRFLLVLVLIYALIGVSLTTLVGWAGQVSLGHFAIVGLAAYLTARWSGQTGWSLLTLILVVGLIGAAATVVIGLPALRVPGLTLAVVTLGFAVIAPDWLYLKPWIGGDTPFTTFVNPPNSLPGLGPIFSQVNVYYPLLIVLVLVMAACALLRRSAPGRVIIAVRDNERASASFGIKPAFVKLRVLALSGFIAATAGVFWAVAWQRTTPVQFGAEVSIAILAIPVIGGLGSLGGAVAGAVFLYMGTFFIGPHLGGLFGSFGQSVGFLLFFSGIGVVGSMIQFPNGIAGKVQSGWQAYLNRRAARIEGSSLVDEGGGAAASTERAPVDVTAIQAQATARFDAQAANPESAAKRAHSPAAAVSAGVPLVVRDVALRFGGIAALDGVDITVQRGEIVGLIGTNGAGKTTLMNVISGALQADRGSIQLYGHDVTRRPAHARARDGLARSFQDASLFAGLTVAETIQVALGRHAGTRRRAEDLLRTFGLQPWADALTVELSTGMRRICDLAAQVAARPRLLLLDEPTAGVAQREAEAFGPLVRRVREELDCSILLIEHDMPLLMGLCGRVYAMESGRVIAEGTPAEIRDDPSVIASYLGTDTTAIVRSGSRPAADPALRPMGARSSRSSS